MPFANIKVIEGVFTVSEKRQIIEKVTEASSASRANACEIRPWSSLKKRKAAIGESADKC